MVVVLAKAAARIDPNGFRDFFSQAAALLQLLQQTDGELSAQELHQRLRATWHSTGLATVYRVLKQLQQA